MSEEEKTLVKKSLLNVVSAPILIKTIKLVWLAQMVVSAVLTATNVRYADQNSSLTLLLKNASNCVVMEKDSTQNVTMEIILMAMDVQEIVK